MALELLLLNLIHDVPTVVLLESMISDATISDFALSPFIACFNPNFMSTIYVVPLKHAMGDVPACARLNIFKWLAC